MSSGDYKLACHCRGLHSLQR